LKPSPKQKEQTQPIGHACNVESPTAGRGDQFVPHNGAQAEYHGRELLS
jgi:hypothetical protein